MARADIFKEQNILKKYNKKMTAVMTTILAAMLLAGCGSETKNAVDTGAAVELTILAAASLTDVCNEIKTEYEAAHPNVTLNFSYGASGALQTQIEEGAPADLFFSAATKQMTALNDEGLMDPDSIVKLLENKVVLIVPEGSDKDITSFEDVATDKVGMIGLQICKELCRRICVFTRLHDSHRIDHLFTGTYGSLADDLDIFAHISIRCIYHATVHCTGFYPGEYRADIGAVVCLCLYRIQNSQRGENLLGVLTYRHTSRLSQTDHAMQKFEGYGFSAAE